MVKFEEFYEKFSNEQNSSLKACFYIGMLTRVVVEELKKEGRSRPENLTRIINPSVKAIVYELFPKLWQKIINYNMFEDNMLLKLLNEYISKQKIENNINGSVAYIYFLRGYNLWFDFKDYYFPQNKQSTQNENEQDKQEDKQSLLF